MLPAFFKNINNILGRDEAVQLFYAKICGDTFPVIARCMFLY